MTGLTTLTPLPPEDWDQSIQHIAQRLGSPLNIHKLIAHNPSLMEAYTPLRYHVVRDSSLSDRHREILILRVAHQIGSEYEWRHHVVRGQAAGLSLDEIESVRAGSDAHCWSREDALMIEVVDQIIAQQELNDQTAAEMLNLLGKEPLLDAIFTVAVYLALGSLLKTFDVAID